MQKYAHLYVGPFRQHLSSVCVCVVGLSVMFPSDCSSMDKLYFGVAATYYCLMLIGWFVNCLPLRKEYLFTLNFEYCLISPGCSLQSRKCLVCCGYGCFWRRLAGSCGPCLS